MTCPYNLLINEMLPLCARGAAGKQEMQQLALRRQIPPTLVAGSLRLLALFRDEPGWLGQVSPAPAATTSHWHSTTEPSGATHWRAAATASERLLLPLGFLLRLPGARSIKRVPLAVPSVCRRLCRRGRRRGGRRGLHVAFRRLLPLRLFGRGVVVVRASLRVLVLYPLAGRNRSRRGRLCRGFGGGFLLCRALLRLLLRLPKQERRSHEKLMHVKTVLQVRNRYLPFPRAPLPPLPPLP